MQVFLDTVKEAENVKLAHTEQQNDLPRKCLQMEWMR